jgi:hypothetical protein
MTAITVTAGKRPAAPAHAAHVSHRGEKASDFEEDMSFALLLGRELVAQIIIKQALFSLDLLDGNPLVIQNLLN